MKKILSHSLLIIGLLLTQSVYAETVVTNGNNSGSGSLRFALANDNKIFISDSVRTIKITETLKYDSSRQLHLGGSGQTIDASDITGNGDILSIDQGSNINISNLNFIGNAKKTNKNSATKVGGKGIFVNVPVTAKGSVKVILDNISISNVGNHAVHVSDCSLRDSCGSGSGADGIELDEGNNGNIYVQMDKSIFDGNGGYCGEIPFVKGSLCDNSGGPDLDDAFDIDETGNGSVFVTISDSNFKNNFDEGLDFDEAGNGNIEMNITNCLLTSNTDEGIKASEEGKGNVISNLTNITLKDNNRDKEGIQIEEGNDGNLSVVITGSNSIGNEDIKLEQSHAGDGTVRVIDSRVSLELGDNKQKLTFRLIV